MEEEKTPDGGRGDAQYQTRARPFGARSILDGHMEAELNREGAHGNAQDVDDDDDSCFNILKYKDRQFTSKNNDAQ